MKARSARGRLAAVCGIDGSGKTTQADLLAARAEAEGLMKVEQISFPRYGDGFFAEVIERYLRGEFAPRAGDVSPYLAALPYACDRWEARARLRTWLKEGSLVICNRYVPANLAHQGAKIDSAAGREAFYRWNLELEYEVFGLPRPDLHILLEVPAEVAAGMLSGRGAEERPTQEKDIHEADRDYLAKTAAAYREIARKTPGRWAMVPCVRSGEMLPRPQIAELVWKHVEDALQEGEQEG